ncbi:MAG: TonB-dependent receptor [Gammaproteobacteria bacterium]
MAGKSVKTALRLSKSPMSSYSVRRFRFAGWLKLCLPLLCLPLLCLPLLCLPASALACAEWVAKVVAVEGLAQRKKNDQPEWLPLQREQMLHRGESIRVGSDSRATLYLCNNTFMNVDADSVIRFSTPTKTTFFGLELKQGIAHFISRIVNRFEVNTPYINAMVEGTEFVVKAADTGSVSVIEGTVAAYNDMDRIQLESGQQAVTTGPQQKLSRIHVQPDAVVAWALYYPAVLSLAELPVETEFDRNRIQTAIQALQQNRVDQALSILRVDHPSNSVQVARAALLLQLGRLSEFDLVVQSVLHGSESGRAYSLKAVAEVVRNDVENGLISAKEAVKRIPNLAISWVSLSYAQQANLHLNDALASARKATDVQPDSALAHFRLSELYLIQGDVNKAREVLEAISFDGIGVDGTGIDRAALEGSKGFIALFRLNLDAAQAHFRKALDLDAANPQYHLGLGLALLRSGQLAQGRREIEFAVSLNPLNSVLRSYVGRAYFEEKRDREAIKQWELAKAFDPNDPTPYFYTGVYKLFANDPVSAIDELERSRDLNDKRAIYRSETLLQSDASSRSATLARAYNEVGYDQGVLLSAWDAIRRDPTNAEGYRLLADYYADDPRYESARVSALLQSQLWQSLSAYPLQPQLNEAGLSVVAGAGPQRPSLNEYHSLFTQEGAYGTMTGYAGSNNTWGNDAVGSFLAGPIAVSLGQFHYETDGWRANTEQNQDIYNGFFQWQLNPATGFQFESRSVSMDRADLAPTIAVTPDTLTRLDTTRKTNRVGMRHTFSNHSAFAMSAVHVESLELETAFDALRVPEPSNSTVTQNLNLVDVQWLSCCHDTSWILGLNVYEQDKQEENHSEQSLFVFDRLTNSEPNSAAAYVNYFGALRHNVDASLGVAYMQTDLDSESEEVVQTLGIPLSPTTGSVSNVHRTWLPSVGLSYRPIEFWSVRAAYFETISRGLASRYTLEPNNLFGFNRVYNDSIGTEAKNFGFASDCRFNEDKCGFAYTRRNLRKPVEGVDDISVVLEREDVVDLYYVNSRLNSVVFSAKGQWARKRFKNEESFLAENISEVVLYQLPLKIMFYNKSGFLFNIEQIFYDQDLEVIGASESLHRTTWITQAEVGYRNRWCGCNVRVGVNNLFDQEEEILNFSERELAFYPGRFWYGSISISL